MCCRDNLHTSQPHIHSSIYIYIYTYTHIYVCMYLCILIYAHKSQHFVEAHFRHKHETGNWAHTAHTLRYDNVKISLKNANFNQAQTSHSSTSHPYCLQQAPSRSRTAAGRCTKFFVAYFSVST